MKKVALILITLFLCTLLSAEDPFSGLSELELWDLSYSYLEVSKQYRELDKIEKADDFEKMAYNIYPALKNRSDEVPPETGIQVLSPAVETTLSPGDPEKIIRYYFFKMVRGVFTENEELITSVLAPMVFVPGYDYGFSREEIDRQLKAAFSTYDLTAYTPEQVWNLSSLTLDRDARGYKLLKIETQPETMSIMSSYTFWGEQQTFFFQYIQEENQDPDWKLIAVDNK